ncbi:hypothetical protein Tco_0403642 [Tanacetum coccineum]
MPPFFGPLAVIGTVLYVLLFSLGFGPVPALLLPEIFARHPFCSNRGVWLLLKQYPNTPIAAERVQQQRSIEGKVMIHLESKMKIGNCLKKINIDNDDVDEGPKEDETYLARVASKLWSALLALAAHATDSTNFLQKEYAQWIVASQRSLLHP